jgi:hypothetical protein
MRGNRLCLAAIVVKADYIPFIRAYQYVAERHCDQSEVANQCTLFVIARQGRNRGLYLMKTMNLVSSLQGSETSPKQSKDTMYCGNPILADK